MAWEITGYPMSAAAPVQNSTTITADTTNGGFNVSYTPPVANTDTFWAVAFIDMTALRNV